MITQEYLKEILHYNKSTGVFTWGFIESRKITEGDKAGWLCNSGYLMITINKKKYLAHRVAWLYIYGYLPSKQIDHINGNRLDNRIKNLRTVTSKENCQNKKMPEKNKSGVIGVRFIEKAKKWEANIGVDKKQIYLGKFDSLIDAKAARIKAEIKYGFHKNHGRKI